MMRLLVLSYWSSSARRIICAVGSAGPPNEPDAVGTLDGPAGTPTNGALFGSNWADAGSTEMLRIEPKQKHTATAQARKRAFHRPCRCSRGRALIAAAITRPPGREARRNLLAPPQAQATRPPLLDVTARPYSNLQSPWTVHRAETPPRCHSKPSWRRRQSGKILKTPSRQEEPSLTARTAAQSGCDTAIYSLQRPSRIVRQFRYTLEGPRTAPSRVSKNSPGPGRPSGWSSPGSYRSHGAGRRWCRRGLVPASSVPAQGPRVWPQCAPERDPHCRR